MHGLSGVMSRNRARDAIEAAPVWTLVAAVIGLHILLTAWQAWFVQINDDGILYVRAARLFAEGRFVEGRAVYSWYFFPLLIGAVSKVTSLDPIIVGKFINSLASVATLSLLLRLSWLQNPSKLTLCAVSVLIFGSYVWNDARSALTRDHLFICFVVLSFFFLFIDRMTPRLAYKAGFAAACVCAGLFRKEAIALLVMVPTLLVASGAYSRSVRALAAAIFVLAICAVVFAVAYQFSGETLSKLLAAPQSRITIIGDQVLWPYTSRRALLAYNSMIAGLITVSTISTLWPLSVAMTGFGLIKSAWFRRLPFLRLFACYFAASMVALSAHTYFGLVFEARYGLFLGLLLAIPAAIAITDLIPASAFDDRRVVIAAGLAVIWLGYGLLGGLKLTDSSSFQRDAGAWLRANVPPDAISLTNNNQIAFYGNLSNVSPDPDFLLRSISGREGISKLRNWANYDVVVLRLRKNQLDQVAGMDTAVGKPSSMQFENSRGDKILIYQPRQHQPSTGIDKAAQGR